MDEITKEMLFAIIPLIILHYGLVIYAITKIVKYKVKSLNKIIWILISVFITLFGPLLYLMIGKSDEVEQDDYDY